MSDNRLKNKEWRINHLYKIRDKNSQLITYKRNRAQREFAENAHTRNIILKSRQLGFSTEEAIDTLDDTVFTPNFDSLFIAQDLKTAEEIFDNKVHLTWKNLPKELKDLWDQERSSARRMKFGFGDGRYSSITVDNTGRSGTFNRVHITELPILYEKYPKRAKEVLEGTIPAVPMDGRVDIESTARGDSGPFYEMFWEAWERGEPDTKIDYKAHFYNWTYDDNEISKISEPLEVPKEFQDYQKKHGLSDTQITYYYLKWVSLNKDWQALFREYPTTPEEAFAYAGEKFFANEKIEFQKQFVKKGEKQGDWTIFEEPEATHYYGIGADVSEGVGKDHSTAVVIDFKPLVPKVVATYKNNKITPDNFAFELKDKGMKYHKALVAPENNSMGYATVSKLNEIYNNVYRQVKHDKSTNKKSTKLGWKTGPSTKPKMLHDLKTAINEDGIQIPSQEILKELRSYTQDDVQYQRTDEDTTRHFDLLIATAIAYQMKDYVNRSTRTKSRKLTASRGKGFRGV